MLSVPGDGRCCLIRGKVILCSHPASSLCVLCCHSTELTCAPDLCIFNLLNRKQMIAVKKVPLILPFLWWLCFIPAELRGEAHSCPAGRRLPELQMVPGPRCQPLTGGCTGTSVCPALEGSEGFTAGAPGIIGVSSWSRHFPQAAGVQFHCPELVPWNNRLVLFC